MIEAALANAMKELAAKEEEWLLGIFGSVENAQLHAEEFELEQKLQTRYEGNSVILSMEMKLRPRGI